MKLILMLVILTTTIFSYADEKIKMNFVNEEITKILELYSKASGQKLIIDSSVRGKVTMLSPADVGLEEAYSQISEALAVNGYAIVKNGDVFTVKNARSAQRDNIQVSPELPGAKPQRLATWVVNLKNISVENMVNEVKLFTSSYGELSVNRQNNQLIITDWTSNLQRVAELIKQVDKPTDPSVAKIVAEVQKERRDRKEKKEIKIVKDKNGKTIKTETTEN